MPRPPKDDWKRDAQGLISTGVAPERALLAHLTIDHASDRHAAHAPENASSQPEPLDHEEEKSSLDELAGLAEAAGAEVVGTITQKRPKPEPATLFGKGKVQEIGQMCEEHNVDVLIVDSELSPAQGKNLEEMLKVRVIDRTELILDIFARRAQTSQAKLQVELAQLRYQLPRLKRLWTHLERQGGAIGTRGPGETQLETDRSMARDRVTLLERQLDGLRRQKKVEASMRYEFELGALLGYTNVGKSALLNRLSNPTGKKVYEADQLFATLGASTRKVELGNGRSILLSDTVGFVRRLPHFLVESFHSTLAEVANADFLLLVVDAADPELEDKMRSVLKVMGELEVLEKPRLLVLNQCDRLDAATRDSMQRTHPDAVLTSALSGEGLDELKERVKVLLAAQDQEFDIVLDARAPHTGKLLSDITRHGQVLHQEWRQPNDGDGATWLCARVRLSPRWREQLSLDDLVLEATPRHNSPLNRAA